MENLYLCADGGGTKVKVVIGMNERIMSRGVGGPCNL